MLIHAEVRKSVLYQTLVCLPAMYQIITVFLLSSLSEGDFLAQIVSYPPRRYFKIHPGAMMQDNMQEGLLVCPSR